MKENPFGGVKIDLKGNKTTLQKQNSAMLKHVKREFKTLARAAGLSQIKLKISPLLEEGCDVAFCSFDCNMIIISEKEIISRMRAKRLITPIIVHELGHFYAYIHGIISRRGKRAIEKQADILGACILKESGFNPNSMVKSYLQEWEYEKLEGRRKITIDPDGYPSFWERAETLARFIKSYWKEKK